MLRFRLYPAPRVNLIRPLTIVALICLLSPFGAFAQGSVPAGGKTAVHPPKEPFRQWLEEYAAWDRVDKQLAQSPDSAAAPLERARVHFLTGDADKALEVIEQTPAYEDPAVEAERLWIGGRAQRALGRADRAVAWFSQAGTLLAENDFRKRVLAEPDMKSLWIDACRAEFWNSRFTGSLTREAQQLVLKRMLAQGRVAWPKSPFWDAAERTSFAAGTFQLGSQQPDANAKSAKNAPSATPQVAPSRQDAGIVARALALVSLENGSDALQALDELSFPEARTFWKFLLSQLADENALTEIHLDIPDGYVKAQAFFTTDEAAAFHSGRTAWLLGNPQSAAWTGFREKILSQGLDAALTSIDHEAGSLLVSPETVRVLHSLKFALALSGGRLDLARSIWDGLDRRALPLSLKLACILLSDTPISALFQDPAEAHRYGPLFADLREAAGNRLPDSPDAPFWIGANETALNDLMAKEWPMDRLLVLAEWQRAWSVGQNTDLAQRLALLFPDTLLGADASLFLAGRAVDAHSFRMAHLYLERLPEQLAPRHEAGRLELLARMEMETGDENAALASYRKLAKTGQPLSAHTRLTMATLLQRKGDLATGKQQLEALLEEPNLDADTRAEAHFWLGEGEQALGNPDGALDQYLHLAWRYPEANIWAVTAMYRAAMIYERQGRFETAKRLLGTVVKNADTKEQREAASARLAAIDAKQRRAAPAAASGSGPDYPF